MTRLFRLSNAIRKSAAAKRTQKIGEYTHDEEANVAVDELRLYTKCYIEHRFPQAPPHLRTALIEANALRLRRLYYQRSHRRRIGLSALDPNADPKPVQMPKIVESSPAIWFAPTLQPKVAKIEPISKPINPLPTPLTYASTARQTAVKALYADSTVTAPRAKSVAVNNTLSFPPVPTTNECPYCGVVIEFKGTAKSMIWR